MPPELANEQTFHIVVTVATAVGTAVFTAASAWFGVKGSVNGMRETLKETRTDVGEVRSEIRTLVASDAGQNERLGRIEERVEAQHGWLRDVANRVERREEARS